MSLQVGLGVVLDGRINEPMIQKARALAKHRNNTSPLAWYPLRDNDFHKVGVETVNESSC